MHSSNAPCRHRIAHHMPHSSLQIIIIFIFDLRFFFNFLGGFSGARKYVQRRKTCLNYAPHVEYLCFFFSPQPSVWLDLGKFPIFPSSKLPFRLSAACSLSEHSLYVSLITTDIILIMYSNKYEKMLIAFFSLFALKLKMK